MTGISLIFDKRVYVEAQRGNEYLPLFIDYLFEGLRLPRLMACG